MISTRLKTERRETNYNYFSFLQTISNTGNLHGFVQNWRSVQQTFREIQTCFLSYPFFFILHYLAKDSKVLWLRTRKNLDVCPGDILADKIFQQLLYSWICIAASSDFYFGLLDASVRRRPPYVISKNVSKMGDGRRISLVKDWTCLAKNFRQSGLSENYLEDDGVSALIFSKVGR